MGLPSANMYDAFKDEIWTELEPLDPNWFDVLTAQTLAHEGSVSDQDELFANQEGNFKTPFNKTAVESQLFSTPKAFRHSRVVSPAAEDEQSFTAEQEKETLPWAAAQSPCLFGMTKEGENGEKYASVQPLSDDSFDLLRTTPKTPVSHAKQICESLGAQVHPDISWTSSLNTPPAVPSTLILSKTDACPSPCVSADKNVVIVRELFPSISHASGVGAVSPKNNDVSSVQQGVVSPEADQNPSTSPQNSLNRSPSVWRQKLPDAIEDGEICSTVASILDGAENVLSIFFTNRSSVQRKVKTDRIRKKQMNPTKEDACNSADSLAADNPASSERRTNDVEPVKHSSPPPVKTADIEITQWSPLSLSDIPPCTSEFPCHASNPAAQVESNIFTEPPQSDSVCGQSVRPFLKTTESGFNKKKRKFIYSIEPSKRQVHGKEGQPLKTGLSPGIPDSGYKVKPLGNGPGEADACSIRQNKAPKQENDVNLPLSIQPKVQDLDMSQLCRDFAQDFSQILNPGKLNEVASDAPRNDFSPSACLSAMKQAKQKSRQTNFYKDSNGVTNTGHVSATNQNSSNDEGGDRVTDSGFQSVVADTSHLSTTLCVPSSENAGQSQQWTGHKTDIQVTSSFPSNKTGNAKYSLDEPDTDAKLRSANKESQSHTESTSTLLPSSAKATVNNLNSFPLTSQVNGSFPEKQTVSLSSVHALGFKTASNRSIHISSANLERAKRLLEEDEAERTFNDQPIKGARHHKEQISTSNQLMRNTVSDSNQSRGSCEKFGDIGCQLTASQKADVTELCTLLEEADSQFEFTQFKTAKVQQHCQDNAAFPQTADKELDPDFLMGIDFDDSFSSDAEKHVAMNAMHDKMVSDSKANCETSKVLSKSTVASLSSAMKKDNPSTADVLSSSSTVSADPQHLDRAGSAQISKQENKNPLMPAVGFQTAGGNVLRVSKKCLSKARALFADLEETWTDQQTLSKQTREVDAKIKQKQVTSTRDKDAARNSENQMDKDLCQSGLQMASGKTINISAKAVQEAETFFKECDIGDSNTGKSIKHKKSIEALPSSVSHMKKHPQVKNVKGIHKNHSEEPISEFEKANAGPSVCHTKVVQPNMEIQSLGFKNMPPAKDAVSFSGNLSSTRKSLPSLSGTTESTGPSPMNQLANGGGFSTASGKKVSVSAEAMKKAQCLLNEVHSLEDANKQLGQKGDPLRTGRLTSQKQDAAPTSGGFQTASGKGVVISSAALKKAQSLLSDCEALEDKVSVKPTHSTKAVPALSSMNGGFQAASRKPIALSAEAIKKAKALFSDIAFTAENPGLSNTRDNDKKHDNVGNSDNVLCGFTTAGGATVHMSQKNLLKATNIFKDFDDGSISAKVTEEANASCDKDSSNGISVKSDKSVLSLKGGDGVDKKHLSKFKQAQKLAHTSEELGNGHSEFENVNTESVVEPENTLMHDDVEIHKGAFKNTPDSSSEKTPLMARPFSSLLCAASKDVDLSVSGDFSHAGGFSTASGKKVTVSDDAMKKAKSLLNDSATTKDTGEEPKQKQDFLPPGNSEYDGVEAKMPVSRLPPNNGGFLAASGKSVTFSSEALRKAKALFSDISLIPAVSDTGKSDKHKGAELNTEQIHCGFITAGGAKVHVSEKNLLKAKNLLKECADEEPVNSNSTSTAPHDTHVAERSEVRDVKRSSNSNFYTARDGDMPENKTAPQELKSIQSLKETDRGNPVARDCISIKEKAPIDASEIPPSWVDNLHDPPESQIETVMDSEKNQGLTCTRSESSVLILQSLNLSGCTKTQQRLVAQEALDCTKALLEDENKAGQRLSVTLENVPQQDSPKSNNRSLGEQKGNGKRSMDAADMTGQPPLKRRLLEEFDRTVDSPRSSTLAPQKSCPNSVMKDRRTFKYSVSLHSNITRPHMNGTAYEQTGLQKATPTQHPAPGDRRSAHSKMPAFVPPFIRNTKADAHKNKLPKDNIRTPSAFVPPFKKQRTFIQESSSKPQEENKHQHLFVTPSNSDAFVLPPKKTQSSIDVTGKESKTDVQTITLINTTSDCLKDNQNVPIGCGSVDSAAEAPSVEDTFSKNQEMSLNFENVELARDMQDMRIRKKKRQTIRPFPGSLFLAKTSGVSRIPLKAAVNGKPPQRYTQKQLYGYGIHQHVSEITSETAETFRFNLGQFLKLEALVNGGGVQLADGGWLIPSNDGTAGKAEFYRALCDTPGVDPKLISEEWVYNHYRWIVWKQAAMERSFPETMGSLCLTPEQVLLQLKYRYDVEIDRSRRPALRKIMERDDTAAKTLVLCVCGIVSRGQTPKRQSRNDARTPQGADAKVEPPSAVVWLTDGWYAIKAQLDEPLTAMLHMGQLAVGGKLITCGAQLVGSQDACSPLEAPESLMLKICTNSSRPARWDAKLGFHRDPRPFLLPVSSFYTNGGPVGCVDITILRSYPLQWMERKPDGGVVFRSVRAEEKEARRYNSQKQKAMEILFAKIQTDFEKEDKGNKPRHRRRTASRQDIANLQDGEELHDAVGDDPAYLEAHLSEQQAKTLQNYRRSLMEKKQAELQDRYRRALEAENSDGGCANRDVTPVWRLCFGDSMDQTGRVYQLNLWRPSSDLQSLLREGCRYKVYNLTTSDGKKRSGIETVQLTGTKKTQFQDVQVSQEWSSVHFQPRVSANFVNLQNPEFQPLCGEVDLTGCIVSVIDGQGSSPAFYLADGRLNFVKVRCFSSFSQSGLEDVVKPRVLLALSNLQLRGQSTCPTPVVYAGDLTVFSTNPKEVHLQESFGHLRNLVQSQENFFQTCEERLSHLIKSDGLSSVCSPAQQPQTPTCTSVRRPDTSLVCQQPLKATGSFTPISSRPAAATSSSERDPRSVKRRRALDYLSRIPSPPSLVHLGSLVSPCVRKTFNPPRRSGTPSTLKTVHTPGHKPAVSQVDDGWVNDEELAMIDTQTLRAGDLV